MYCPNCAASIEGVKFCRSCGTNVSLVPQAITGRLPQPERTHELELHLRTIANPERNGIREMVLGGAFLLLAFLTTVWLLIPAFVLIGKGIGKLVSLRMARRYIAELTGQQAAVPNPVTAQARAVTGAPDTDELPRGPAGHDSRSSVVEGTTRHLEATTGRPEQNV